MKGVLLKSLSPPIHVNTRTDTLKKKIIPKIKTWAAQTHTQRHTHTYKRGNSERCHLCEERSVFQTVSGSEFAFSVECKSGWIKQHLASADGLSLCICVYICVCVYACTVMMPAGAWIWCRQIYRQSPSPVRTHLSLFSLSRCPFTAFWLIIFHFFFSSVLLTDLCLLQLSSWFLLTTLFFPIINKTKQKKHAWGQKGKKLASTNTAVTYTHKSQKTSSRLCAINLYQL